MAKSIFLNDKYKKVRGGYSRLLDIQFAKCETHFCYYQKDGPGILKRMYLDRIYGSKQYSGLEHVNLKTVPQLVCRKCHQLIGMPLNYKKENGLAYRLFVGAINKNIAKESNVKV